jgi:hypothetical protein
MVMRDIGAYYKGGIVPGLEVMTIFSDGCTGQYKGKMNFRKMATFHLESQGLEAHRAAADADSKTARAAIEQAQQQYSVRVASIQHATTLLSQAEITARSEEFEMPSHAMKSISKSMQADNQRAVAGNTAGATAALGILQHHEFMQVLKSWIT